MTRIETAARVGPVLHVSPRTTTIVEAIRALNSDVQVLDRGSYLRVSAPKRCVLTREMIESLDGRPFLLPMDLEAVMTSFAGRFSCSEDTALWESGEEK